MTERQNNSVKPNADLTVDFHRHLLAPDRGKRYFRLQSKCAVPARVVSSWPSCFGI